MVHLFWKTLTISYYSYYIIQLNILLLYNPAAPLLGIYQREMKMYMQKNFYTNVHINIIHIAQNCKEHTCNNMDELQKMLSIKKPQKSTYCLI